MNDGGRRWNGWTDAVIGVVVVVEEVTGVIVEVVEGTEDARVGKRKRVVVGKEEVEARVGVEAGLDQGLGIGIGRSVVWVEKCRRMDG